MFVKEMLSGSSSLGAVVNESDQEPRGFWVRSLTLLSGLGIWHCRELWCRSKTRLGSRVAVALIQTGSYSSHQTPSLGTSICQGIHPRKGKKPKKKRKERNVKCLFNLFFFFPCLFRAAPLAFGTGWILRPHGYQLGLLPLSHNGNSRQTHLKMNVLEFLS